MTPATYLTAPCPQDFIKYLELSDFTLVKQDQRTGSLTYRRGLTVVSITTDIMNIKQGGVSTDIFIMHRSYLDILQLINDDVFAKTVFPFKPVRKSIKACFKSHDNIRA